MMAGNDLHSFRFHLLARTQYIRAQGDGYLRTDAEPQVVVSGDSIPQDRGRISKPGEYFGAGDRQILPRANVERHALPAPGIALELQSGKRLGVRTRRDAILLAIAAELPANDIIHHHRRNPFQHLHLLIANGFAVAADWSLH